MRARLRNVAPTLQEKSPVPAEAPLAAALVLALGVLLAGVGRLISIGRVGLPRPTAVWLGYLIPELTLPFVVAGAHYLSP